MTKPTLKFIRSETVPQDQDGLDPMAGSVVQTVRNQLAACRRYSNNSQFPLTFALGRIEVNGEIVVVGLAGFVMKPEEGEQFLDHFRQAFTTMMDQAGKHLKEQP